MRKRSGRLGGKGVPGSARSAILNYLAALEPAELAPLVQLFLQPISSAFQQQQDSNTAQDAAKTASSDRFGSMTCLTALLAHVCICPQDKVAVVAVQAGGVVRLSAPDQMSSTSNTEYQVLECCQHAVCRHDIAQGLARHSTCAQFLLPPHHF